MQRYARERKQEVNFLMRLSSACIPFCAGENLFYVAEECFEDVFEDLEEDFFFEEVECVFVDFFPEDFFEVACFELFA
jgi:hypothetical protein